MPCHLRYNLYAWSGNLHHPLSILSIINIWLNLCCPGSSRGNVRTREGEREWENELSTLSRFILYSSNLLRRIIDIMENHGTKKTHDIIHIRVSSSVCVCVCFFFKSIQYTPSNRHTHTHTHTHTESTNWMLLYLYYAWARILVNHRKPTKKRNEEKKKTTENWCQYTNTHILMHSYTQRELNLDCFYIYI